MPAFPDIAFPPFRPHRWLVRADLMTLFVRAPRPSLLPLARAAEERIVRVSERTRVQVALDRPRGVVPRAAVVLMHGLVGDAESLYVLGTARKLVDAGFLVARVNARNCGGTEHLTLEPYNGGQTEELEAVSLELVEREGIERVHLVGFSIGGNQALALAVRLAPAPPAWLSSVCGVSPCIDFAASTAMLERGVFEQLVEWRFLVGLKAMVRRRHELAAGANDRHEVGEPGGVDEVQTIRAFDERFTAPMSGFANADDYYARASVRHRLDELVTPTLLIAAEDDPLVPFEVFESVPREGPVRLLATAHGGHVTFLGRRPAANAAWQDVDRRWAENRVVQFIATLEGRTPDLAEAR